MRPLLAAITLLLAAPYTPARTPETAIVAAMKLSENPNYSWVCTVSDDAQTYDIEGKTDHGFTWQRQPMPKVVARRLGREAGRDLEAIFSAPLRYVVQTETGWRRLDELPKEASEWMEDQWIYVPVPQPIVRTPDMPADGDPLGFPPVIFVPVAPPDEVDDHKVYSNAQFALALPHEELAVIVSSYASFEVEADTVAGLLTDLGAQLLLVHDGHEYIRPVTAGGRFKVWFKGEVVEKYALELAGVVLVDGKTVYVQQKSTTTLSNIGTTTVLVPPDARQRL